MSKVSNRQIVFLVVLTFDWIERCKQRTTTLQCIWMSINCYGFPLWLPFSSEHWWTLVNIGEHWWTLVNIGEHWWTLVSIGEHWWTLWTMATIGDSPSSNCPSPVSFVTSRNIITVLILILIYILPPMSSLRWTFASICSSASLNSRIAHTQNTLSLFNLKMNIIRMGQDKPNLIIWRSNLESDRYQMFSVIKPDARYLGPFFTQIED